MSHNFEEIREQYERSVATGETGTFLQPPVYPHGLENPYDPDGPPLYGPHKVDLRGIQIVRTEDGRLPRRGLAVDTPDVRFLFLPPPSKFTTRRIQLPPL